MNYRRKTLLKQLLAALGLVIVAGSFWYTDRLVEDIAKEERKQIKLWAEAIQKKARLVNYTDILFEQLRSEERKKVLLYMEANKRLASEENNLDLTFLTNILSDNNTVPVIWTDETGKVKATRNLDSIAEKNPVMRAAILEEMRAAYPPIEIKYLNDRRDFLYYKDSRLITDLEYTFHDLQQSFISEVVTNAASSPVIFTDSTRTRIIAVGNIDSSLFDTPAKTAALISEMESANTPIAVTLEEGSRYFIFYEDSALLRQLRYYPVVQFIAIGLFILLGYYFFHLSRRSEQNLIWAGMAKETAHQLGTPLSSLLGWINYLQEKYPGEQAAGELMKDAERLRDIAERFSKIGSVPELFPLSLYRQTLDALAYLEKRSSRNVQIHLQCPEHLKTAEAKINPTLFQWVIENLAKNAIDAMSGKGKLNLSIGETPQHLYLDVSDTGKGIPQGEKNRIFKPGFTTKQRGWGLGLALARRIIEEYHKGRIWLYASKPTEGSTFRISLKKISDDRHT
jgi:hypothetical protein